MAKGVLDLGPIGLGANFVGGHNLFENVQDDVGKQIIETAIDYGITFIDTAYVYGFGRSEELIGEVLAKKKQREDIVIATKAGHKKTENGIVVDNHPDFIVDEVERALKRLQTDYIDLFYLHYPDEQTPKAEIVGVLQRLKEQGKIKAIGLSNFSVAQLKEANQDGYVDYVQDEYNLLNRQAEKELFPILEENNIGFIPYFPLASGILAGKYTKDSVFTDGRSKRPEYQGERFVETLDKVEQLKQLAAKYETDVSNVVLAYYLTKPIIPSIIPGAKRPEQVKENIQAGKLILSSEDQQFISELFPVR
ncbi:MAG: aldo/keto reductase [Solibacillus sp.]